MKNSTVPIVAVAVLAVIVAASFAYYFYFHNVGMQEQPTYMSITSFEGCAAAGYPIMESFPAQCRTPDGRLFVQEVPAATVDESVVPYFTENVWKRAVENNGGLMPIEGFDPNLFMGAYPGMEKSDFHEVAAIGGKWVYDSTSDELSFVRTGEEGYITSADGTISEEGMPALLENMATRLNFQITTNSSVDGLLDQISIPKD